jgi:beta-lactamase superfamily II metal-dependent hydrolase
MEKHSVLLERPGGRPLTGRLKLVLALVPFLATLAVAVAAQPEQASGTLKVHVLNVGQGDAIYIECPEAARHNMLIDTGDLNEMRYPGSPKLFQDELMRLLGDNKHIDVVVASHAHSDHAGSLLWVLNNMQVGTFVDNGVKYDSKTYAKILERAKELSAGGHLRFLHATELSNGARDTDFCPATNIDAVLVRPDHFGGDANPNNDSVVIRLNYNAQKFLFTGDAEEEEEQELLADPHTKAMLPATVLKAPHHGSNTSSSQAFLDAVHPRMIVVSAGEKDVGTNKGYKHPRAETVTRFLAFTKGSGDVDLRMIDAYDTAAKKWVRMQINAGVYVTSVDGTVVISSDGQQTWKEDSLVTGAPGVTVLRYVYSRNSDIYHFADCADAKRIKPENRVISDTPPAGKELHRGCPR